jgi:hypothetical protein
MYMTTALGNGEAEVKLEQFLYDDKETTPETAPMRMGRHFEVEIFIVGAAVFSAVHFDMTDNGIEQFGVAVKGSEQARDKGQGQTVPKLIDETHEKYQYDRLTFILDSDSFTPEKLLHLGYTALQIIPEQCQIAFVDPEELNENRISDLAAA